MKKNPRANARRDGERPSSERARDRSRARVRNLDVVRGVDSDDESRLVECMDRGERVAAGRANEDLRRKRENM